MRRIQAVAFSLLLIGIACSAIAQAQTRSIASRAIPAGQHWVATWGAAQNPARIPPAPPTVRMGPTPAMQSSAPGAALSGAASTAPTAPAATPAVSAPPRRFNNPPAVSSFNNQTVRMILRTSIGGETLRVRLYSAFGEPTVAIGAAHVALHAKDSGIVPGSDRTLTFSGKPVATLYAGQVLISDPVKLTVAPLSDLAVSLYLPGETGPPTTHALGLRPAYTSGPGDFTTSPEIANPVNVSQSYYWLEGVDVLAPSDAAAIVTFGDSITDGDQSTPGMDAMWPAILAERLHASNGTGRIAVVNEGISGNRILGENVSGLVRFAHQALDVPGVRWITVLEGINDINLAMRTPSAPAPGGMPGAAPFSADDLIAAYRQLIDAAHARGIKVIGCTLTPYGGSSNYKDQGEAIREAANDWIRQSGHFDAVIDFEAATRDSADPKRYSGASDSPDMLHPGDAGYKLMGNAIKLSIFSTK